jgi:hypothetical protein
VLQLAVTNSDRRAVFPYSIGTADTNFFMIKNSAGALSEILSYVANALWMAVSMSLQTVSVVSWMSDWAWTTVKHTWEGEEDRKAVARTWGNPVLLYAVGCGIIKFRVQK